MRHEETFSHEPSIPDLSLVHFTVLYRLRFSRPTISCRITASPVQPAGAGLATNIELSWPEKDGTLHHLRDRCKTCLYRDTECLMPSLPRECARSQQALPGDPERR